MSWIIGVCGKSAGQLSSQIKSFIASPIVEYKEANFCIYAGGNSRTCLSVIEKQSEEKFIAVGVGLEINSSKIGLMNTSHWKNVTDNRTARKLGGHFVCVRWNDNKVKIFTDVLGLRDIYLAKPNDGTILFSTRGDRLSKICGSEIDFKEFGSRWLLFNQISNKSIFTKLERICCGQSVEIDRQTYKPVTENYNWLPKPADKKTTLEEFSGKIEQLVTAPLLEGRKISLSLSGGMDSRLILSYLLNSENKNWDTHTFGSINHPDSIISKRIAGDNGFEQSHIDKEILSVDEFLKEAREYLLITNVNNGVSGYLQIRNYLELANGEEIIIDGGFGEIWRREFFNRLLIRGRSKLTTRDAGEMLPYLYVHRADIFNDDLKKIFLEGCKEQLNNSIQSLPDANSIGLENWIDLFAVKTRLSNYYSSAQSHLDNLVCGYMPFIQHNVLEALFNVDLSLRKNGKMFRDILCRNRKTLTAYSLAKGNLSIPYSFNTLQSRLWSAVYKNLRLKAFNDDSRKKLFVMLRPLILDVINSKDVKECCLYNQTRLISLSDKLTKGLETEFELHELDWWIAFELFRKGLQN
jgi:hypothetical protein